MGQTTRGDLHHDNAQRAVGGRVVNRSDRPASPVAGHLAYGSRGSKSLRTVQVDNCCRFGSGSLIVEELTDRRQQLECFFSVEGRSASDEHRDRTAGLFELVPIHQLGCT
jgi:hypothetical protein